MPVKTKPRTARQAAGERVGHVSVSLPPGSAMHALNLMYPAEPKYAHEPVLWAQEKLRLFMWSKQIEIMEAVAQHRKVAVQSCHGPGKGLALDTPLPTPTGWTTMRKIKPGDQLFDEEGKVCSVSWISPVRHRQCYQVIFDDRSTIVTDDQHLWLYLEGRVCKELRRDQPHDYRDDWEYAKLATTPDLGADLVAPGARKTPQRNVFIPTARPLQLASADLPIDPYVLGAWLGDGTACNAGFTTADPQMVDEFAQRGWELRKGNSAGYSYSMHPYGEDGLARGGNTVLREAGLKSNKHIPEEYLRSSEEQRLELLRGLMDTDGTACGHGEVCFGQNDGVLARQVVELIRSLGWKTRVRLSPARPATARSPKRKPGLGVSFRPDKPVFYLKRKLLAQSWQNIAQASRHTIRAVISVEPIRSVPTRCISVDSPRSMFLAGENMVPTHNSFTASSIGAWWLDPETHPLGSAFLVTTAPSWSQVQAILWREIRRRFREGKLAGRITLDCQWYQGDVGAKRGDISEELIGMGRKPADYDTDTFQGIHARYFMAILDEACGIPEGLWDGVLSLATNENSRILAIGNPDDPNSRFARYCGDPEEWHTIKISAFDTPLFTGEYVPPLVAEGLVSPAWVAERTRDWGEGTPTYISKVLGEFPDISEDYLFPPRLIEKAKQNDLPGFDLGRYGMDVARWGDSYTVIYRNRGGQIRFEERWGLADTVETKTRGVKILTKGGMIKVPMTIDATGVGGGVYDQMRHERHPVNPYYGAERARNPKKFKNRRSEVYWTFREMMDKGLIDLDPSDDRLIGQLTNIKWAMDTQEKIQVETKEDMKERGVPSPDFADAAVLSTVELGSLLEESRRKKAGSITGDLMSKVM